MSGCQWPRRLGFNPRSSHTKVSIIRYVSWVKWSNPGKRIAPYPTSQCSSYWKRSFWLALDYGRQLCFYIYIYIYTHILCSISRFGILMFYIYIYIHIYIYCCIVAFQDLVYWYYIYIYIYILLYCVAFQDLVYWYLYIYIYIYTVEVLWGIYFFDEKQYTRICIHAEEFWMKVV